MKVQLKTNKFKIIICVLLFSIVMSNIVGLKGYAQNALDKQSVINAFGSISYVDTYYLTTYGDLDSQYECYRYNESKSAYPQFIFFKKNILVTKESELQKLSTIALANHYKEYYSDVVDALAAIKEGVDSAIVTRIWERVGSFSSKLAGTIIGVYLGNSVTLTKEASAIMLNSLIGVSVKEFTNLLIDIKDNLDAFNIYFTFYHAQNAKVILEFVENNQSSSSIKTYEKAKYICDVLQEMRESKEMATSMLQQVSHDTPTIVDYLKNIGIEFIGGEVTGIYDSFFLNAKLKTDADKAKYLDLLVSGSKAESEEFYKILRLGYKFKEFKKVSGDGMNLIEDMCSVSNDFFPYANKILEAKLTAQEFKRTKVAEAYNKVALMEKGYKVEDDGGVFYAKFVFNYPGAQDVVCYTAQEAIDFVPNMYRQTRAGYTFVNWYYDAAGTIEYDGDFYEGIVLYAKWKKNPETKFTITFKSNCAEVDDYSYTYDTTVGNWVDYTMERPGYIFAGWYWDSACTQSATGTIIINKDLTFYAKWIKRYYNITFKSNCAEVDDYSYTYDKILKNWLMPKMTRPGYTFIGWYWDSACTQSAAGTITVNKDLTFYAKWECQYSYTVSNNKATITGIKHLQVIEGVTKTDIELPRTIDGYAVVAIANSAFKNKGNLTRIVIPNSVTSIGDNAFEDCTSLASISVPDSVTSIGSSAFDNTKYYNNSANWESGLLYIGNFLVAADEDINSANIKYGITYIADGAFEDCSSLTSVTIPDGVTSIPDNAFSWCSSLTSVTLRNGVTSIGESAFYYCTSLASITIPDGVTSIGGDAFFESGLKNITMPKSLTSIGGGAFVGCPLKDVIIGSGVENIGSCAFENCDDLISVSIPSSVTSIANDTFSSCSRLTNIEVSESNMHYSSKDGVLFNKNKTELIKYPVGNARSEYKIPEGVISICDGAFEDCSSLTSVTIPDGVTSIPDNAFSWCSSLTSVTLRNGVTSIGESAFLYCTSLASITIPDGVIRICGGAFEDCLKLKNITIPDSVTSIEDGAFADCASLSDVYYTGSEAEWNEFKENIGAGNEKLLNATIHYNYKLTQTSVSADGATFTVSPVNVENGKVVILALYDGNKFVGMQKAIYQGEELIFTTDKAYTKAKVMVWNDLTNLNAVCLAEELQAPEDDGLVDSGSGDDDSNFGDWGV